MFLRPTVFIVGAGASAEFGFPLGKELGQEIRQAFLLRDNGMHLDCPARDLIAEAAKVRGCNVNEYVEPARRLHTGLAYFKSIDDFLQQRQADELLVQIAKMAISRIILGREKNSALYTT